MDIQELTQGDVLALTGVTPKELRHWYEQGIVEPQEIKPATPGGRTLRRYSVLQTLGIAVGVHYRRSDRGCALSWVRMVVEAFENTSLAELEKQFAKGSTHLACVHQGKLMLAGAQYDWPNVEAIYREMMRKMESMAAEYRQSRYGRPTGLAQAVRQ